MIKSIAKTLTLLIFIVLVCKNVTAQYSNKKIRPKYQAYTDSLKNHKYDYVFPIFGQKTYQKGFDIPYPAGIMTNYMWLRQGIVISNLQLGFKTDDKDIPLTPVDFIQFGENTNTSYSINVRPDLWIFPFLNVYGIFGYGNSTTEVNLTYPVEIQSIVDQSLATYGFGVLGAFGIGPVWMSVDANFTWNKPELLDKAVPVNVLGVRLGHTFVFQHKPERNIAVWIGAQRVSMGAETVGEIQLSDALPPETWDKADEIVEGYWIWYDNLNPNNPIDKRKIEKADEVLTPIVNKIDEADGSTIIRYGMDKQVKEMWNGVIGVQFQLNKRWMVRSEGGIIGDRKSFLFSLNYRFLM